MSLVAFVQVMGGDYLKDEGARRVEVRAGLVPEQPGARVRHGCLPGW